VSVHFHRQVDNSDGQTTCGKRATVPVIPYRRFQLQLQYSVVMQPLQLVDDAGWSAMEHSIAVVNPGKVQSHQTIEIDLSDFEKERTH